MTKQRKIILDTIRESSRHMTAEDIYLEAREKMPSLAIATVYNNLRALTAQGIVRRLQFAGLPDRYDRNMAYHEHLICECCGEVTDAQIEQFLPMLEKQLGTHITHYHLSLYHVCSACQSADAEKKDEEGT